MTTDELREIADTLPRVALCHTNSYTSQGHVVAIFYTLRGAPRVVFEFDAPAGLLHIFNAGQVELPA